MALKSMALTAEEKQGLETPTFLSKEMEFPMSLQLFFDGSVVEKLELKKNPAAGSKMTLVATVDIERVSDVDDEGGKRTEMMVQITDMALMNKVADSDIRDLEGFS